MRIYSVSVFFKKFSRLTPPTKCNDDFKVICSKRKLNGKLSREWMNGVVSKEGFRPGIKSVDKIIAACVKF